MNDIERELQALGDEVFFPPTPDVASAVMTRLAKPTHRRRVVPWLVAAVVIAVVLVAVPGPRRAVADLLGIGAASIEQVADLPTALATSDPPGDPVHLATAVDLASFPIVAPAGAAPDEVHIAGTGDSAVVTLTYGEAAQPNLVITEVYGHTESPIIEKSLGPGTDVEEVAVPGYDEALWISGAPHVLVYVDGSGVVQTTEPRLAGNTLIVVDGDVTIRLETAGDLDDVRNVATSLVAAK